MLREKFPHIKELIAAILIDMNWLVKHDFREHLIALWCTISQIANSYVCLMQTTVRFMAIMALFSFMLIERNMPLLLVFRIIHYITPETPCMPWTSDIIECTVTTEDRECDPISGWRIKLVFLVSFLNMRHWGVRYKMVRL